MIDINRAAAWFQGRITVTSLEAEGHFSGSRVSFFPVGHRCTWWPALSGPWVACSADQLRGWTQALKIQNFKTSLEAKSMFTCRQSLESCRSNWWGWIGRRTGGGAFTLYQQFSGTSCTFVGTLCTFGTPCTFETPCTFGTPCSVLASLEAKSVFTLPPYTLYLIHYTSSPLPSSCQQRKDRARKICKIHRVAVWENLDWNIFISFLINIKLSFIYFFIFIK